MNRLSLLTLAALSLLACGSPLTPQSACEEQIDPTCKKMWNCTGAAFKVGTDEASCKTSYKSLCALAATCASGKTFDSTNAAACGPALEAQSCDEYSAGAPASCANQCK